MDFMEEALGRTIEFCETLLELNEKNEAIIQIHEEFKTTTDAFIVTVVNHSEMKDVIIRKLLEDLAKRDENIQSLKNLATVDQQLRNTSNTTINLLQGHVRMRDDRINILNDQLKAAEEKNQLFEAIIQQAVQSVAASQTDERSRQSPSLKRRSTDGEIPAKKPKNN